MATYRKDGHGREASPKIPSACFKSTRGNIPSEGETCLVVDQDLHRVVPPLDEHQLVGLTRDRVGERRAHSRGRVGLEPHAHGEGVHLRQTLLHLRVHVVGSQWERELEFIQRPVVPLTCGEGVHRG